MRVRLWPVLPAASALAVGWAFSGAAAGNASSAPVLEKPLAPGVVGDYFPNKTPDQLARKRHLCQGATPQRHAHFFTSDGLFGSLDQHGQQVDDGSYRVTGARKVRINDVRLHYEIDRTADGDVLALKPVITKRMRRQALADPLEFSTAGYAVAVAYTGHTWNRKPCPPCG